MATSHSIKMTSHVRMKLVTKMLLVIVLILVLATPSWGRTVANAQKTNNNKTSSTGNQLHQLLGSGSHNGGGLSEAPHEGMAGGLNENNTDDGGGHGDGGHGDGGYIGIKVAGFNWHHVQQPFIITMVLIAAAILKLGFHHAGRLPEFVPESCLLIVLGTIVGGILYWTKSPLFNNLEPSVFFLFLLPPIILESAYSLYDRVFFDNLGTILLYAVVGTILNCFLIGPVLYGLAKAGAMGSSALVGSLSFIHCLVFASLIVAVDPVAVLAIFHEVGVNNVLYFLVFGESLLNDAVTVVLYNMMKAFNRMDGNIPISQIFLGIASFFTISLIGMAIGIFFGILTALFTKYTAKVRVVEPLAVFTLAYASYLTADLFEFSGIISIFACGLVQAHFSFHNVSHKSSTTILYFSKIMSTTSDCIIFMFLGLALWNDRHVWNTGFVIWTIVLCLVFRFIIVYFLTYLANNIKRIRKINLEEQFIMAYGGLRGAVAFSLVAMLNKKNLPDDVASMFETTTLVMVLFTVFVQGMTIKPLTKLLRITKEGEKVVSLCDEITNHVTDHLMAGIEEVIGYSGRNKIREALDFYDDKYFKKMLQRSPLTKDETIMELYKEIAIQDHYDTLACNVDMGRYSSQMVLYHPKGDEEDEAFVAVASAHPDLADRALDNHLYRRNTINRGYYHPRTRAQTVPSRMFSDPGSDYNPGTGHDVEAVGYPRKTTSVDTDPQAHGEVTVDDLRKWLVKPASESLHQKHNKNILQDTQPDLMHLLHEKQLRTSRYLRSISVSLTPEGGSPTGSPGIQHHPFVFPRQRSETTRPGSTVHYRRSFTPGSRVRYDSDGPLTALRMRTRSEAASAHFGSGDAAMKFRSVSMGAVAGPGDSPQLAPIKEDTSRKVNANQGENNNEASPHIPHVHMRQRPASYSGSVQGPSSPLPPSPLATVVNARQEQEGAENTESRTRRNLLSRQDKVRDVSPSKSSQSRDVSPSKAAQSHDVTDSIVDAQLPRVRFPSGEQKVIESETHL